MTSNDPIKLVCDRCSAFAGLVGADGTGPVHDECLHEGGPPGRSGEHGCPIVDICAQWRPVERPMGLGNGGAGATDIDDWGSMYDHARNAEDHR